MGLHTHIMDMDTDLRAIYSVIIKFYIMELITVMTFMLHPIPKESPLRCKTCYIYPTAENNLCTELIFSVFFSRSHNSMKQDYSKSGDVILFYITIDMLRSKDFISHFIMIFQ